MKLFNIVNNLYMPLQINGDIVNATDRTGVMMQFSVKVVACVKECLLKCDYISRGVTLTGLFAHSEFMKGCHLYIRCWGYKVLHIVNS